MVSTTRPTLVNTDSVDEIARRSRGAANAPLEGREARLEKSTISCQAGRDGVLFFRKVDKSGESKLHFWVEPRSSLRAIGRRKTPVLPDGLWREGIQESSGGYGILDRRVAALLASRSERRAL